MWTLLPNEMMLSLSLTDFKVETICKDFSQHPRAFCKTLEFGFTWKSFRISKITSLVPYQVGLWWKESKLLKIFIYYSSVKNNFSYKIFGCISIERKFRFKFYHTTSLRKNWPSFFCFVFSRVRTEYGDLQSKSSNPVQMRGNTDQKNHRIPRFPMLQKYYEAILRMVK